MSIATVPPGPQHRADDVEVTPVPLAKADGRRESAADQIRVLRGLRGGAIDAALRALQRSGLLWRINLTVRGDWLGTPVAIPIIFGNGVQHLRSGERWMVDVLKRVLQLRAGTFVDVGANLGQTLLKVKMLDRAREYYAFEPNPVAVSYLRQLIERNRFPATHLFPFALADGARVAHLFSKADADPSASIVEGFRAPNRYSRSETVSVHRGDDVLRTREQSIAILKVDVEGGELDVLEGLTGTIGEDRPYILCEVLPVYDPATDTGRVRMRRQTALLTLLGSLDYVACRIGSTATIEPVDDFGVHGDITRSNYMFLPQSEMGRVVSALGTKNGRPSL